MAENEPQKFGLDATDYFTAMDKIIQYNKAHADSLIKMGQKLGNVVGALKSYITGFNETAEITDEMVAKAKLLGATFDKQGQIVSLTRDKVREHTKAMKEAVASSDNYVNAAKNLIAADKERAIALESLLNLRKKLEVPFQETRDVRIQQAESTPSLITQAVSQLPDPAAVESKRLEVQLAKEQAAEETRVNVVLSQQAELYNELKASAKEEAAILTSRLNASKSQGRRDAVDEEERKAAVLKQQADLYKQLEADNARMNQYEREHLAQLNAQLEITRELQAANAQGRAGINAANLGANLTERYSGGAASLAAMQRVSASVNQITAEVARGEVTVERVLQILGSVEQREAQIFEGAEERVAMAARALQGAETQFGGTQFLNRQQTVVKTIIDQNNRLRFSFNDALDSGKNAASQIILSWTSMARLFEIQALHNLVYQFIDALRASIGTTVEFERRVSEIRTITQDQPRTFGEWADQVRRLSDEFGNPILEVTEGLYETISNQIGKGAEATAFMRSALEFSKVTFASTADSVNLLSSAINSYGMDVSETDKIASIFFSTIDKGRIRADQIANTFGRVGPIAHQLGVRLDETAAALSTITLAGVPADESMVLLNNILLHLAKPSEEMNEFFKELKVSSGEMAISVYGFANVLSMLEERARGSTSEMAKLLPEMRALRGGMIFAGEGIKTYGEHLDAARNAQQRFNTAVGISMESPGAKLAIEFERLKNVAIYDFGQPFLEIVLKISHALSDEGLAGVFKGTIALVKDAAIAYGSYRLALVAIAIAEEALQITETAVAAAELRRTAAIIPLMDAQLAYAAAATDLRIVLADLATGTSVLTAAEIETAVVQENAAAAAVTLAAAETEVTAATTLGEAAWAGLAGILANPVFLMTAAIAGVAYLISLHYRLQKEIEESYATAKKAASDYYDQVSREADKSAAQQLEAFRDSLNKQFAAYEYFASQIGIKLDDLTSNFKTKATQAVDVAKEALKDYIRSYDEGTKKIIDFQRDMVNEIRKAEEQLSKFREDAHEREFKAQMREAEHKDRMAGGVFDTQQLDLLKKESDRLRAEILRLNKPTGDAKTDLANTQQAQSDYKKLQDLQDQTEERRFKIEEQRKKAAEELLELNKRIAEHGQLAANQDEANDLKKQARDEKALGQRARHKTPSEMAHEARAGGIADLLGENQESGQGIRSAEEARRDDEKRKALEAQIAAYDSAINLMPTINDYETTRLKNLKLEEQSLQNQQKLAKDLADQAEAEAKKREQSFENLRAIFDRIEKFKFEGKKPFEKQADVDKQADAFGAMIKEAKAAGLTDQGVLLKFIEEQNALKMQGEQEVRAYQQKANAERLAADKTEIEARRTKQQATIKTLAEKTRDIAKDIGGFLGAPSEQGFKPGIFESQYATRGVGGGQLYFDNEELSEPLNKAREAMAKLLDAQDKMQKGGPILDPKKIKESTDLIQSFIYKINAAQIAGNSVREDVIQTGRTDPKTGKPLPDYTIGNAIDEFQASLNKLTGSLNAEVRNREGVDTLTKLLDSLSTRNKDLETAFKAENLAHQAAIKSTDDLATEMNKLIQTMRDLRDWVDKQNAGKGVSFGGFTPTISPTAVAYTGGQQAGSASINIENINVQATGKLEYDGRALAAALNKELSRGTVRLNTGESA